jgi:ATP/maltotriose-dependent transcriptional regulator MalT
MLRRAVAGADPANRSRLLPALVDVELAAGDVAAARSAADEISRSTSGSSRPMEQALRAQAEASVLLVEGEVGMALEAARRAWRLWFGLEAPYLAACCRILAGRACAALGDRDSAAMEFEAAKVDLAEIGAGPAVAEVLRFTAEDPGTHNGPLTARELDVLRLVAEGKANRDIARTLYLSDKTVARHVSNILTKLGLTSRTAATKYAFEHDLVR